MEQYYLRGDAFVIEEFDRKPPFTSFLPGLAGRKGIPLWAFTVNRGQAVCSFGIHNKDCAAMEFDPAVVAYENTPAKGFRTLLRVNGRAFQPFFTPGTASRTMEIRENSLLLREDDPESGIRTSVRYFLMPNEEYGALVRRVTFENRSRRPAALEVLDGMPRILPYGLKNGEFKHLSNLLRSWTEVQNLEEGAPFYTLRSTTDDSAEVGEVKGGWFVLPVAADGVVYDPAALFGEDTSLREPEVFRAGGLAAVLARPQCFANRIPCAFAALSRALAPGESAGLDVLYSFAESPGQGNARAARIRTAGYLDQKEAEAEALVRELTDEVETHTGEPLFDRYVRQCYLDNLLRGGYPFVFNPGKEPAVLHLFSRKHGDPERDYNFFSTAGEYYSQGNGNFRDVCQNRRNDVLFHPPAGEENVRTFASLLQADGYNPLEVRGTAFTIRPGREGELDALLGRAGARALAPLFRAPFTPGQASNRIAREGLSLALPEDEFLSELLLLCEPNREAAHKEGFWSDHWTYLLDLVESYRRIYPERMGALLFTEGFCRTYDSPCRVLPRAEKAGLTGRGPRQYGAVVLDLEKKERGRDPEQTAWLPDADGSPAVCSLYAKLVQLAAVKFATLDPEGMGIEMEAGKPGWNDAMNGLPGLFGSGMSETFELLRLLRFLREQEGVFELPVEVERLLAGLDGLLREEGLSRFERWDRAAALREQYRESVRFALSGERAAWHAGRLHPILARMAAALEEGVARAQAIGGGLTPTFFSFEPTGYEELRGPGGSPAQTAYGLPAIRATGFRAVPLPHFLEGPARQLKVLDDPAAARELHRRVRASELYDRTLRMYKTSVPLDGISMENGRIRAFTPGWQERESVFLHMEYKYLLGMLYAGLYDEFFAEMKDTLIPFQPAGRYGRSILENCSFLASSRNPDPRLHGRGFVCRLSGSTTEMLSMWAFLLLGPDWFTWEEGALCLRFAPVLPGWMFDGEGTVSFRLVSRCRVVYHNPGRRATFGPGAVCARSVRLPDGTTAPEGCLRGAAAESVRAGECPELHVYFE